MKSKTGITALMVVAIFSSAHLGSVFAEPSQPGSGHHGMKTQGTKNMHHSGMAKHHGASSKHGGAHFFGKPWKDTLTKEQTLQIDKMHLKLMKETSVIKAKIAAAKLEMAILLIDDSPSQSKINKKVNEISELSQKKMTLRNAHVVDMRKVLNEEQRVSFDGKVLSMAKSSHKKH